MRRLSATLLLACALICLCFSQGVAPARSYGKILPLGDSITKGIAGGYRAILRKMLLQDKIDFQFVGTQVDPLLPEAPNHEGHAGWKVDYFLNGYVEDPTVGKLTDWLTASKPDVVLILAGTNDDPGPLETYEDLYRKLLKTVYDYNATTKVVFSLIPPSSLNLGRKVASQDRDGLRGYARIRYDGLKRQAGQTVANEFAKAGYPIAIVDPMPLWNDAMVSDGVHPTPAGYKVIAQRFRDGLLRLFGY